MNTVDCSKSPSASRNLDALILREVVHAHVDTIQDHDHPKALLILPVRGAYYERVRGTEVFCQPGTIRLLPAAELHRKRLTGAVRLLFIEPGPPILAHFCGRHIAALEPTLLSGPYSSNLAQRIIREYSSLDPLAPLALECLVFEILIEQHRLRRHRPVNSHSSPVIMRVRDLLHATLADNPPLQEIARMSGMHPVYLSREFHRVFKCTMTDYVRGLRMEKAKALISQSNKALSEIASLCGFYDQSHFARSFKASVGVSPFEYIKQNRTAPTT
ncbi:MAG TPA: AraC family transcriptional regulator [Terriglobales bacterium]|nr:AraC family transcriptional regulator [Terriglobales bacterium]